MPSSLNTIVVSTRMDRDALAGAVASTQHGILTTAQLLECGFSYQTITRYRERGLLVPVYQRVWSTWTGPLTFEARCVAATLALGDGAAVSHLTAAYLHRIIRDQPARIEVSCDTNCRRLPDADVHVCHTLDRAAFVVVGNTRRTDVTRTLLDLGDTFTPHELADAVHEARHHHRWLKPRHIQDLVARTSGRRAGSVLGRAIELHVSGIGGVQSPLEKRYLETHLFHGGIEPETNVVITVGRTSMRVDALFRDHMFVVECDGSSHDREPSQANDDDRDRALRRCGYQVTRCNKWTVDEIAHRTAAMFPAKGRRARNRWRHS